MSNVLDIEKQHQIRALDALGRSLRAIEAATGVRRETISAYLKAAGIPVRRRGGRPGTWPPNPATTEETSTDPPSANPATTPEVSTDLRPMRSPQTSACALYREVIVEALARGRNAMAIWQDLVDGHGFRHGYPTADFASCRRRYDLILAANGDRSIWDYRRALTADGGYAMTGGSNRQLIEALLLGPLLSIRRRQFGSVLVTPRQADLLVLQQLSETGRLRPAIDRRFPLSDAADAVRYVEDGRARGKVVISI